VIWLWKAHWLLTWVIASATHAAGFNSLTLFHPSLVQGFNFSSNPQIAIDLRRSLLVSQLVAVSFAAPTFLGWRNVFSVRGTEYAVIACFVVLDDGSDRTPVSNDPYTNAKSHSAEQKCRYCPMPTQFQPLPSCHGESL
jgi:hypothetical protein